MYLRRYDSTPSLDSLCLSERSYIRSTSLYRFFREPIPWRITRSSVSVYLLLSACMSVCVSFLQSVCLSLLMSLHLRFPSLSAFLSGAVSLSARMALVCMLMPSKCYICLILGHCYYQWSSLQIISCVSHVELSFGLLPTVFYIYLRYNRHIRYPCKSHQMVTLCLSLCLSLSTILRFLARVLVYWCEWRVVSVHDRIGTKPN